jgi:hypothetical protein
VIPAWALALMPGKLIEIVPLKEELLVISVIDWE